MPLIIAENHSVPIQPITAILILRAVYSMRSRKNFASSFPFRRTPRLAGPFNSRDRWIRIFLRCSITTDKFISGEIYRARTWHVRGVGDTHASLRYFGCGWSCATPELIRSPCARVRLLQPRDAALDHRLAYPGEPCRRSSRNVSCYHQKGRLVSERGKRSR